MQLNLRKELFEAVHLNQVWPEELQANSKLSNYEYVHYTKTGEDLIVEMKFLDDFTDFCYAHYYFDAKDKLQKITISQRDEVTILYDRQVSIAKAYLRLIEVEGEQVAKKILTYKIAS